MTLVVEWDLKDTKWSNQCILPMRFDLNFPKIINSLTMLNACHVMVIACFNICTCNYYTPGIYADGYIVFAFPFVCSFVRSLVRFFVRNSGTFVEFTSKFWLKFL